MSSLKLFLKTDGGWPVLQHEPQQISVKRMYVRHVRERLSTSGGGGGGGSGTPVQLTKGLRPLSLPPKVVLLASVSWQSFTGFQMCAGEQMIGIKFLPEAFRACILQSWRWLISGAFYKIAVLRITLLAILGEDCTEKDMHRMLVLFITEVRILNARLLVTLLLLCGKARRFIFNSFCTLIKCSSGFSAADPLF